VPNLRQLHLIHSELHRCNLALLVGRLLSFSELASQGFSVKPGQMGENVTTAGLNLLALPKGT
jgi:MOSC domain-containing protein YiiM